MTWLFLFSFNEEGIEGLPYPCGINVIFVLARRHRFSSPRLFVT